MATAIITCTSCGKQAEHKAKNLCSACYQRQQSKPAKRVRQPRQCDECGLVKPYKGGGLCVTCHSRKTAALRRSKPIKCKKCGETRYEAAKGLCDTCYAHARGRNTPWALRRPSACGQCGTVAERYLKGQCVRCYEAARNRSNGPTVACKACNELRNHVAHGLCRPCYWAAYPRKAALTIICAECGQSRPHDAWGLCTACYTRQNRAVRRNWQRRRYATDPAFRHRVIQSVHRRQRRLDLIPGSHTYDEWAAVCEFFEHKCVYCGADIKGRATRDHVIPISKDGASDSIENIVPACKPCNSRKGTRSAVEFIRLLHAEKQAAAKKPKD